jgi:two-component system cell cycle response regulator DivK
VTDVVLIVEDNDRNRKLFRDVLTLGGFRTIEAETGADGVSLAQEERPDVVLMDIQLPDLDGVECLARLRAGNTPYAGPVVALTAYAMRDDARRLQEAGFDGYISKPVDIKQFVGQVRAFCVAHG